MTHFCRLKKEAHHTSTTKMPHIFTTKTIKRRTRAALTTSNLKHLGVDEVAEGCNSFMLVPKPNGKV